MDGMVGLDGLDGTVMIGHKYSKSTSGAHKHLRKDCQIIQSIYKNKKKQEWAPEQINVKPSKGSKTAGSSTRHFLVSSFLRPPSTPGLCSSGPTPPPPPSPSHQHHLPLTPPTPPSYDLPTTPLLCSVRDPIWQLASNNKSKVEYLVPPLSLVLLVETLLTPPINNPSCS